ncbi:hypothetical protein LINGRAHAP2_LOCUS2366, partial [Linum grandiflorum]
EFVWYPSAFLAQGSIGNRVLTRKLLSVFERIISERQ